MKIGKYTYGHENIQHFALRGGTYEIGNFCSISHNIKIYTGRGSHRKEWVSTYPFGLINQKTFHSDEPNIINGGDVKVGNDVWIGANVTIMPGVTVGSGVIIANNAHVVKDCPPYSIVGGNPAKVISRRFTDEQIKRLLEINWWTWEDDKINENLHLICSENIEDFLENHFS